MRKEPYTIIGAAFGLASRQHDVSKAPATLREAGLMDELIELGLDIEDAGDVSLPADTKFKESPVGLKYYHEVLEFQKLLAQKTTEILEAGRRPIMIGGDHSCSIASISAVSEYIQRTRGKDATLGLLWIDAHPDLNTPETSPSGNIHGMPLATLLGHGDERLCKIAGDKIGKLCVDDVVMIGLRDVDDGERELIKELDMAAYSMKSIDLLGIGEVCRQAFDRLKDKDALYVSFDLDSVDPILAPAVGTPVRGGLTYREAHLLMELASKQENFFTFDFVELNPALADDGRSIEIAKSFFESALGKTIL